MKAWFTQSFAEAPWMKEEELRRASIAPATISSTISLAMSLCFGASAVWVGTRFICAKEAGAPPRHQQAVINADYHDTIRTIIFTGRPMRVLKNEYILNWESRPEEIKKLTGQK